MLAKRGIENFLQLYQSKAVNILKIKTAADEGELRG